MTGSRKPRHRSKTPDPNRWAACARCGEHHTTDAHWPEGPICSYCYRAAKRQEGTCVDCGHIGMIPGLDANDEPICLRCSGIPLNITCARCGKEAYLAKGSTCWRCLLDDLVRDLLSGPDGAVSTSLEPLAVAIAAMPRANSGVTWIRANPKVRELLRALGDGTVELTHEALDNLPGSRTVEFIRGLLVANDALPPRDRLLAAYERWLHKKLETIADDDHRRIVERFGRWHHLRKLRDHAKAGPVESGPFLRAKQSTTVAVQFLAWLATRGRELGGCTQHDLDSWYGTGPSTRQHVERFLYWCRSNRLTPKLEIPRRSDDSHDLIGENERIRIIRSLLLHDELSAAYRIAGCLVTLYGQSVGRIVTLTVDDIRIDGEHAKARLADDWIDLPEPLAALVKWHIENRPNTNTAANAHTKWLFPGRMPGEHINRQTMLDALRNAGVPVRAARNTSWQQLVREAPPQVLAKALGVSATTAMRHAERAGSDWTRYAADRSAARS
ncbi:Fis family transcriptional regulator (plasmid) [Prescottella equi]|uniref:Fis family transcriptional regulator n=1 Tax=Rhodococcus hoagii TaxID=43767 RepID=UPI002576B5F6|nr:Fis family transcriptional regulator [Prescottella equi]WJJ14429.1 Fis family transcriptional regulator [Prescottella equi]